MAADVLLAAFSFAPLVSGCAAGFCRLAEEIQLSASRNNRVSSSASVTGG
jgi:hypothetical protein